MNVWQFLRPGTLLAVFMLAGMGCGLGCTRPTSVTPSADEQVRPTEKLIPAQNRILEDIPTPKGARFKAKSSRAYWTGQQRSIEYSYGIWAKKSLVNDFYQENMPVHGWELTNSMMIGQVYCLNYRKANETCRITIGPTNWYFQNLIEIFIQPVGGRGS